MTALLVASGSGDQAALDQLTPLVRAELQRLAGQQMGGEHAGHSLKDDRKHEGPVAGLTVRGLSDAGHDARRIRGHPPMIRHAPLLHSG